LENAQTQENQLQAGKEHSTDFLADYGAVQSVWMKGKNVNIKLGVQLTLW